jgi:hypothetical protein
VDVDDARHEREAAGVDGSPRGLVALREHDPSLAHAHIAHRCGLAGAVDDSRAAE